MTGRILLLCVLLLGNAQADVVQQLIDEGGKRLTAEVRNQRQVDNLAEDSARLTNEFKQLSRDVNGLEAYQRLLQLQLDDQLSRIEGMQASLQQVADMEREILPLSERMIATLRKFVQLDVPFLLAEREQRLQQLEGLLARADVSTAEKFRQVMEAYQIENEYGRTIEAYRDDIELDGRIHQVSFLRVGRIALLYLSDDSQFVGHWDTLNDSWQPLSQNSVRDIRNGLRVARKQLAPSLLKVPVAMNVGATP